MLCPRKSRDRQPGPALGPGAHQLRRDAGPEDGLHGGIDEVLVVAVVLGTEVEHDGEVVLLGLSQDLLQGWDLLALCPVSVLAGEALHRGEGLLLQGAALCQRLSRAD